MFYLRYLRSELLRRRTRTVLTVLGLAVGVALVIVISALSRGLDRAQKTALDPLSSIGTDLTVTRSTDSGDGGLGGEVIQANSSVITDLSKLGEPGDHFVHDFFLPGTQLTFPTSQGEAVKQLESVSAAAQGLLLVAQHQEGTVPKIVAELQTGGQTFDITRQIKPPTAAEQAQIEKCLDKAGVTTIEPPQQGEDGGGFRGGGQGRGERLGGALGKCLPERFQRLRTTFTTPRETLRQVLDPPQTDIETSSYAIGGVDQTQPDIGLVTTEQVTAGRYFSAAGGKEALLATTYAERKGLKVGSTLALNGKKFEVVGLVAPPLGGQTADVYLPLAQLQALAGQKGLANVILVRAHDSSSVAAVKEQIERELGEGAQVATAGDVAGTITGSLVDAADLSRSLGFVLQIVVAAAAFLLAGLLTLSSVGKRVRELGTLKAIGWTQRLVVRQVVGESVVQGIAGGVAGIGLGILGAKLFDGFGPQLTASSTSGGEFLGLSSVRTASTDIALNAPLTLGLLLLGLALALGGGLLAGAAGGLRAGRLRPADALRTVE